MEARFGLKAKNMKDLSFMSKFLLAYRHPFTTKYICVLVIVGGHENKGEKPEKKVQEAHRSKEVVDIFVKLTGKKDSTIEVITTGGSEGDEASKDYHKACTSLGAKQVGHIHHDKR